MKHIERRVEERTRQTAHVDADRIETSKSKGIRNSRIERRLNKLAKIQESFYREIFLRRCKGWEESRETGRESFLSRQRRDCARNIESRDVAVNAASFCSLRSRRG